MALLCRMGLHNWQGCRCSRCGQTRESGHDWMKNCELCARCGRKRSGVHQWINHIGVRCSHCGMTASNVLNPAGSVGRVSYCLFPPGERVYLVNCNDRWNLEAAGRLYENIWMRGGQTGTVLGYHAGGAVVVRWDEQAWEQEYEQCSYCQTTIPVFDFPMHVAYLRSLRAPTFWSGGSSAPTGNGLIRICLAFYKEGDACLYEEVNQDGIFWPWASRWSWKQKGPAVWLGGYAPRDNKQIVYEFTGMIDGERMSGALAECGSPARGDWNLERVK